MMISMIFWSILSASPKTWDSLKIQLKRNFQHRSIELRLAPSQTPEKPIHYEIYRYRTLHDDDRKVLEGDLTAENEFSMKDWRREIRQRGLEEWKPGAHYYVILRSDEFAPVDFKSETIRAPH